MDYYNCAYGCTTKLPQGTGEHEFTVSAALESLLSPSRKYYKCKTVL